MRSVFSLPLGDFLEFVFLADREPSYCYCVPVPAQCSDGLVDMAEVLLPRLLSRLPERENRRFIAC